MRKRFLKSGWGAAAVFAAAVALFIGMTGAAFTEETPEIFPQLGQSGWIQQVAMSNDGKYVLTADFGGTVMLWETETGREIRKLPGESHLDSIAFSPDGKYAVCNQAVTVKLLDLLTGREIYAAKKKDPYNPGAISFLAGGRYFMISGNMYPPQVWETATGRDMGGLALPEDFHKRSGQTVVTPGSRLAMIQMYDQVKMRQEPAQLWDLIAGRVVREVARPVPYYSVFTADGKVLSARTAPLPSPPARPTERCGSGMRQPAGRCKPSPCPRGSSRCSFRPTAGRSSFSTGPFSAIKKRPGFTIPSRGGRSRPSPKTNSNPWPSRPTAV